jgi:hypothetical protein
LISDFFFIFLEKVRKVGVLDVVVCKRSGHDIDLVEYLCFYFLLFHLGYETPLCILLVLDIFGKEVGKVCFSDNFVIKSAMRNHVVDSVGEIHPNCSVFFDETSCSAVWFIISPFSILDFISFFCEKVAQVGKLNILVLIIKRKLLSNFISSNFPYDSLGLWW